MKAEVKFSEWIKQGFELFKANAQVLILANLVAIILSICSIFILLGPMVAGLIIVTLGLLDKKEPKPDVGDVFKGFAYFLQSFLFMLVFGLGIAIIFCILSFIPCIGHILMFVLALTIPAFLMFSMWLIVDKNMEFWPATMENFNVVISNFWSFLGFSIVVNLIGQAGVLVCCIGGFITAPICMCIMAVAYRDVFGSPSASAEQSQSST